LPVGPRVVALDMLALATAVFATLVTALPSTDGLIVCADRRAASPGNETAENFRKVFPAGPDAVFTTNGLVAFTHADKTVFDARETTSRLIAKHGFPKTRDEYHVVMQGLIDDFTRSGLAQKAPAVSYDGPLVRVTFYSFEGDKPKITALGIFYTAGVSKGPDIRIREIPDDIDFCGQDYVPTEIVRGKDPRFEDLRSAYRAMWGGGRRPSARAVVEFSRRLIRESSKRTHLLTAEAVYISETADCAQVSKQGERI
jgi:hypothetical protein